MTNAYEDFARDCEGVSYASARGMNALGYESLADVLHRAYAQAASGKGADRHANGLPFDQQPMQTISALLGSADGLKFQAIKKTQESGRLSPDAAVRELLGAINYLAGAVMFIERGSVMVPANDNHDCTSAYGCPSPDACKRAGVCLVQRHG